MVRRPRNFPSFIQEVFLCAWVRQISLLQNFWPPSGTCGGLPFILLASRPFMRVECGMATFSLIIGTSIGHLLVVLFRQVCQIQESTIWYGTSIRGSLLLVSRLVVKFPPCIVIDYHRGGPISIFVISDQYHTGTTSIGRPGNPRTITSWSGEGPLIVSRFLF